MKCFETLDIICHSTKSFIIFCRDYVALRGYE